MATFARTAFGHASYASYRPSYSPSLFRTILAYHNAHPGARTDTLLDLGCGHGIVARHLEPHFQTVHATDPSAGMVAQAQKLLLGDSDSGNPKVHIRQAQVEDLSFLPAGSVDLAVAGQAAHWFDYSRAWPQLARAVRSGGSIAFAGYKDHVIVDRPATSAAFERFTYGEGEVAPGGIEGMGRFWEQPGREILRDSFRAIEPPPAEWEDVRRLTWDPDRSTASVAGVPEELLWQRKRLTLGALEGYVRTYSAYSNWREAHPGRRSRAEGGEGDVVDYMFEAVVGAVPEWQAARAADGGESAWREIEVDVIWGTAVLLARRR